MIPSKALEKICKRSRGFPFENLSFKINNFGYPEIIENFYDPLKGT